MGTARRGASDASGLVLPRERVTRQIRLWQQAHALALLVVPAAGTVVAAALAVRDGVTWLEPALFTVMYMATSLGVTVGMHRHLAHSAFAAPAWLRAGLAVLGCMAAQGPVVYWVANHRRHHRFSDVAGDPHSPWVDGDRTLDGGLAALWHAHAGWSFDHALTNTLHVAKDLLRDRTLVRINRLYLGWVALGLALPAVVGGLAAGAHGALLGLLWGGLVRLFVCTHATAAINSWTHRFGRRPFDTKERSTNAAWLALPTLGESWHNNHHAFPYAAVFGLRWWQVDVGGMVIVALEAVGLAWDVRRARPEAVHAKSGASR